MERTRTIYRLIRIDYRTDNNKDLEDNDDSAIDLAINPNYHTIMNGVCIDDVEIMECEEF